jgi:outer membrane protein TolC
MRRIYVLVLSSFLLTGISLARDLTLSQALQLAEAHSFAVKKSASNAQAAAAAFRASKAERFPTLSLTSTNYYLSEVPRLSISFPGVSLNRDVGVFQNYQNDLRLNLPLFTGGKISGGIDATSSNYEINEALASADEKRITYQARLEYFNLYKLDKLLGSAQAELKRTGIINKDVQSLYDAGVADSSDILDASLALQKAMLAVDQVSSNRRASEIRLLLILGLDPAETLSPTEILPEPKSESVAAELPITKPELIAAEAGVKLQQANLKLSQAEYFPTVAVYGGYSYGRPNLDRFNNTWNDNWTFGANLNWSFNLGGRTPNKSHAANYLLDAAKNERDLTHENLDRDLRLAFEQLKLAYTRYKNSQVQYKLSADNFRLSQEKHRNGTMSANRLLEVETDLTAAEAGLSAALVDYYLAQSTYFYAAGSDELGKGN